MRPARDEECDSGDSGDRAVPFENLLNHQMASLRPPGGEATQPLNIGSLSEAHLRLQREFRPTRPPNRFEPMYTSWKQQLCQVSKKILRTTTARVLIAQPCVCLLLSRDYLAQPYVCNGIRRRHHRAPLGRSMRRDGSSPFPYCRLCDSESAVGTSSGRPATLLHPHPRLVPAAP